MKKIITAIILAVMLMASNLYAAGSCTETVLDYTGGAVVVTLACTGDAVNGSIPTITISTATMALLAGKYYLYTVTAYPTPAGDAPDAADVTVLMLGQDLLGGKGVNLIHATATQDAFPYNVFLSSYRFPMIIGGLTVAVANQATAAADYTLKLVFVR